VGPHECVEKRAVMRTEQLMKPFFAIEWTNEAKPTFVTIEESLAIRSKDRALDSFGTPRQLLFP
jgi:hypothetical protein